MRHETPNERATRIASAKERRLDGRIRQDQEKIADVYAFGMFIAFCVSVVSIVWIAWG